MVISLAGTGYVGLSNAIILAQHNKVFAVDLIQSKVGGIPDVINDNNGMLIDFDEQLKSKLTESMLYCKAHIAGINNMLDRNYQSNTENVSIERTCKEYLQLFNGGKL